MVSSCSMLQAFALRLPCVLSALAPACCQRRARFTSPIVLLAASQRIWVTIEWQRRGGMPCFTCGCVLSSRSRCGLLVSWSRCRAACLLVVLGVFGMHSGIMRASLRASGMACCSQPSGRAWAVGFGVVVVTVTRWLRWLCVPVPISPVHISVPTCRWLDVNSMPSSMPSMLDAERTQRIAACTA